MIDSAELLQSSVWARALDARVLERVASDTGARTFDAGAVVGPVGGAVDAWTGVLDGLIKINKFSPGGKTVTFTGVPRGGWFGEGSLLKREARRYEVTALRPSRVAYMPCATFEWLLDTSIAFNRFLIAQLNERLGQFIAAMEYERLLDPEGRVARAIASMFNPILYPGTDLLLQISQEELGFLAGVSRQRVNQALQALERAGLIRSAYAGVAILDLAGLRNYGGDAPSAPRPMP